MFNLKTKTQSEKPTLQDLACQAVVDLDAKAAELRADLARQEAKAAEVEKRLGEELVAGSGTLETMSSGLIEERAKVDLLRSALAALERRRPAMVEAIADARAQMLGAEASGLIREAEQVEAAAKRHWEALAEIEFNGELVGVGDVPRIQSKSESLRGRASELNREAASLRFSKAEGRDHLRSYRQRKGLPVEG